VAYLCVSPNPPLVAAPSSCVSVPNPLWLQSEYEQAVKAAVKVHPSLFPELRRPGNDRKPETDAVFGKNFGAQKNVSHRGYFIYTSAVLKRVAVQK
jgi:hypothetical protein